LVGPAIAGLIVHRLGVAYAFDLNALSFLAVIFAVSWVTYEPRNPALAQRDTSAQFRDAMNWVRNHPGARRIIISMAALALLSAPLQGLMPFFASDVFNIGANGLGYLLACVGAGAVTGAFLLGQLPQFYPRHHLIPISMFFLGIFQLLFAQAPNASFSYPILYICGIFWLWTLVSSNTAMQLLVPDNIRGRAMSILLLAHIGMLPTGHMLGGLLARWVGPRSTLSMTSIGLIFGGLLTLIRRVPEIDGLDIPAKRFKLRNFFSEVGLAGSHRAEAMALDRSSERVATEK
jgi:MFS family permease